MQQQVWQVKTCINSSVAATLKWLIYAMIGNDEFMKTQAKYYQSPKMNTNSYLPSLQHVGKNISPSY